MKSREEICRRCREVIVEVLYQDEAGKVPQDLNEHLKLCEACRSEVESLRGTLEIIRGAGLAVRPPAGMEERIIAAIEAHLALRRVSQGAGEGASYREAIAHLLRRLRLLVLHPAMAAAATLLIVASFLFLLREEILKKREGRDLEVEKRGLVIPPPAQEVAQESEKAPAEEIAKSAGAAAVDEQQSHAGPLSSPPPSAETSVRRARKGRGLVGAPEQEVAFEKALPTLAAPSPRAPVHKSIGKGGGSGMKKEAKAKKGEELGVALADKPVPKEAVPFHEMEKGELLDEAGASAAMAASPQDALATRKEQVKDPFQAALEEYGKGNYDGALTILSSILKNPSTSTAGLAQVYLQMGRSWKKKGNNAKAILYYENLFARYPTFAQIDQARWEAAEIYIDMGDTQAARALLEKLAKKEKWKEKAQKKLNSL